MSKRIMSVNLGTTINYAERVVWSPENGGCLMIQRKYNKGSFYRGKLGVWLDWSSMNEGEFPSFESAQDALR